MDEDRDVVVVSMGEYSWNILIKEKFYAFPLRSRKVGKYFAFYRKGVIAHYAEVESSEQGDKEKVGIGYWLHCMPDAEPPYQIVRFNKILKLKKEIKKESSKGGHIQGTRYTTLKKLLNARIISELA